MEILDIVNDDNQVIGQVDFHEVYKQKLNHRIVHVLVFNQAGEMLLQKRSQLKKFCPGFWSTSVGGHVQVGESYLQAAARETKEELGVVLDLQEIGQAKFQTDFGIIKFLTLFKAESEGEFKPDLDEVEEIKFFPLPEIYQMVERGENFHPELLYILNNFLTIRNS